MASGRASARRSRRQAAVRRSSGPHPAGRPGPCAPSGCAASSPRRRRRAPASSAVWRVQPANSPASGISAAGATMRRSVTPSVASACQAERATREWRMSPTIATARPVEALLALRDGERIEQPLGRVRHVRLARRQHAHVRRDVRGHERRARRPRRRGSRTRPRAATASVKTVSSMLSPLTREDSCTSRLTTSAPRRLAASSKRHAGARRGLGEQVGDRGPGEQRAHGRRGAEGAHERLGALEQLLELRARQPLERQQVAQRAVGPQLRKVVGHGGQELISPRPRTSARESPPRPRCRCRRARTRRRRCAARAARLERRVRLEGRDQRSSTMCTGRAKRRSSSAAKLARGSGQRPLRCRRHYTGADDEESRGECAHLARDGVPVRTRGGR